MEYKVVLDWPYWFDVFILSLICFVIIGTIAITHLNEYQLNLSDVKFYLNCCNVKDKRLYLSIKETSVKQHIMKECE